MEFYKYVKYRLHIVNNLVRIARLWFTYVRKSNEALVKVPDNVTYIKSLLRKVQIYCNTEILCFVNRYEGQLRTDQTVFVISCAFSHCEKQ